MSNRLLLLNWRDPWHPAAGGAELLTYRIATRLVATYGWEVEWFSGDYPGAIEGARDGVTFVHSGTQLTVHLHAFARYRDARFDAIVDETNTIPFLTPLYAKMPTLLFINQLAREVWFHEAPLALAAIGYVVEPLLLAAYRQKPVVTISDSSAKSLRQVGLRGPMTVIPMSVDDEGDATIPDKVVTNDIAVLGRLTPSKRVEESIKAAHLLVKAGWRGTLHIAGGGSPSYRNRLERLAKELGVPANFHGRISNDERQSLLARATLLWMTSAREGWGLVVTEAGRHWTPAVVYDSPGLRDSVRNLETGLVVLATPEALAAATRQLLSDPARLYAYAKSAREFAIQLTWDETARAFDAALRDAIAPASSPYRIGALPE